MLKIIILLGVILLQTHTLVFAQNISLEAKFPYTLGENHNSEIATYSTQPLYLNIENKYNEQKEIAELEVLVPKAMEISKNDWTVLEVEDKYSLKKKIKLDEHYGNSFQILYLKVMPELPLGNNKIIVRLKLKSARVIETEIRFKHISGKIKLESNSSVDSEKNSWYIHNLVLPVDSNGIKDDRIDSSMIYIKDIGLENFRNKFLGNGAINWGSVYNHPATYISLELRNPNRDTKLIRFRAELHDKNTGKILPGLVTAGQVNDNQENYNQTTETATLALFALEGKKNQLVTLPLYIDHARLIAGEYTLRITLNSGQEEKVREVPIKISKNRVAGSYALIVSCASFLLLLGLMWRLKLTIKRIGAKGAITVALFAAISFGCITVPTTLLGDLIQVILGPFSGLVTGLLSGLVLYSLLIALLTLYREIGVVALLFLLKMLLGALLFGRLTPLGVLICAVNIFFIEATLVLTDFYKSKVSNRSKIILISLALGITDALITFVNLEQMMFFYRLYYADWYIALHMLFNGIIYSSVGSYFGFKLGSKLQQIMGE